MKKLPSMLLSVLLICAILLPMSPGAAAENRDVDPPLWEQWGAESLEDFMEWYGIESEEEYYNLVEEYILELEWRKNYYAEELMLMGGTAGIVNVMFNGRFIEFADAVPEYSGDAIFVPFRALLEVMGASVGYDAGAVTAELADMSLSIVIGEPEMSLTRGGETIKIDLAAAPYNNNGSVFVPVRAVAEALGFDVYWDDDHESVVILDLDGIAAKIDEDFYFVNALLKMPIKLQSRQGTSKTTMDIKAAVTQFDSISGDTVTKVNASVTSYFDGKSVSMTCRLDLSALVSLLYTDLYYYDEEIPEIVGTIEKALKDAEVKLILDFEGDVLYLKVPALSEFVPAYPADAWIKVSGVSEYLEELGLESLDADSMTSMPSLEDITGLASAGAFICESSSAYYQQYDQIYLYEDIMDTAVYYKSLFGDDNFSKSGNTFTFSVPWEKYLETLGEYSQYMMPGKFELDAVIKTDGTAITAISGNFYQLQGYYSTTLNACEFDISPTAVKFRYELHQKNSMKAVIEINSATSSSTAAVPKAPPAGSTVININELLRSGGFTPDESLLVITEVAAAAFKVI